MLTVDELVKMMSSDVCVCVCVRLCVTCVRLPCVHYCARRSQGWGSCWPHQDQAHPHTDIPPLPFPPQKHSLPCHTHAHTPNMTLQIRPHTHTHTHTHAHSHMPKAHMRRHTHTHTHLQTLLFQHQPRECRAVESCDRRNLHPRRPHAHMPVLRGELGF
jgi:hypothetical protein